MIIQVLNTPTLLPSPTLIPSVSPHIASVSGTLITLFTSGSPVVGGFDLRTLIGLSGLTLVESWVKYLQNQWNLPKTGMLPVCASLISGIVLNVALAWYLHMDISSAIATGALTGVAASGYHEMTS